MTHLARSGHTVAKPRSAVVTAALKSLTADTFISPHAAAQGVGLAGVGRTLQTTAKKASITSPREHGVSKKLDGEGKAGIKSDGHHGTLRVQHHIAQRGSAGVSFHHRLARDD